MKQNYQLDKAKMAFKSQRFDECLTSYEEALNNEFSEEGWMGLSIAKLHLISENQTPKDVLYSLNKTLELYPKSSKELTLDLLKNTKYLIHKFVDLIAQLDVQIAKENRNKKFALVAAAGTMLMSANSKSTLWSRRFKLATGAGLGYSMKKWADEEDTKVVRNGVYYTIKDLIYVVSTYVETNNIKLDEVNTFLEEGDQKLLEAKE